MSVVTDPFNPSAFSPARLRHFMEAATGGHDRARASQASRLTRRNRWTRGPRAEHGVDLLYVRRDDHKPQTDPLSGALPALPGIHVRDLEIALLGAAVGLGTLTAPRGADAPPPA